MHLERLPRLSLRLLSRTAPLSRCFVFNTFWYSTGKLPSYICQLGPNHSICVASRCSTTGDVPLDAFSPFIHPSIRPSIHPCMPPSIYPSVRPSIHLSIDPSIHFSIHPCIHSGMHRHMYTAAWCTVCYGWRVRIVHPKCVAASAVNATAAPD